MSIGLETLRQLVGKLDPFKPLEASSDLYVELDSDGARCERACTEQLKRTVVLNPEPTCQLFTGFPGSGKTTELRRLAARLEADKNVSTHVVFVDFDDFIDRHSPISIADVLRILAFNLDRAAMDAEGKDPESSPGYLLRFWDYLATTDADLKSIGFGAYGASLMLELKRNPKFAQRVADAIQGRFQQFAKEALDAMSEAVARLGAAPGVAAQRVLVIADGLEKLSPINEDERPMLEDSVERLFITHQELLRLPCHVIYTFPLWLRFRTAQLGAAYGREPVVLPMVKVAHPDGSAHDPGLAKLRELVQRRLGERTSEVFGAESDAALTEIIRASGGYPRDVLRMVRSLLMDVDEPPVSGGDVQRVIAELAATYSDTILGTYLDVLVAVGINHALPRDDEQQRALFGHLFEHWLILAYRNGEEWYDLHPLVRRDRLVNERMQASIRLS